MNQGTSIIWDEECDENTALSISPQYQTHQVQWGGRTIVVHNISEDLDVKFPDDDDSLSELSTDGASDVDLSVFRYKSGSFGHCRKGSLSVGLPERLPVVVKFARFGIHIDIYQRKKVKTYGIVHTLEQS